MDAEAAGTTTVGADGSAVLGWYDFVCPFCYLAQRDNERLEERGVELVELPFCAHPEIPEGGVHVGPRSGPMYAHIDRLAAALDLPLRWPDRLPSTRMALGASEWIRVHSPQHAAAFRSAMFGAHFAGGMDIGTRVVVLGQASMVGADDRVLADALDSGEADALRARAEAMGRSLGVRGTPAWFHGGRLVSGLQEGSLYERLGLTPD